MSELEDEHEALLQFVYLCPVGLIQFDGAGVVEMMNPLAVQMLLPLAPGGEVDNFLDLIGHLAPEVPGLVKGFAQESGTLCTDHRIQIAEGERKVSDPTVFALTLLQIFPGRLMAVISDISAQAAQERRIRQNEAWFSAIFNGVNDFAIYMLDSAGRVESWNNSGKRLTGFEAADMIGQPAILSGDYRDEGDLNFKLGLARRNGWHLEEGWFTREDGTRFWSNSLISVLDKIGEEEPGFCVVIRNMTDRKRTMEEMRRLMTTDQLTGACNRYQFFELAEVERARWERYGHELTAIMIDADKFKRVNDTYGHAVGDRVLRHMADLCRQQLRDIDIVARLGGEEFAVLLPATGHAGGRLVAERLRAKFESTPILLDDGSPLFVTASFGVSALNDQVRSITALLKVADHALYEAKRNGRNQVCSASDQDAAILIA